MVVTGSVLVVFDGSFCYSNRGMRTLNVFDNVRRAAEIVALSFLGLTYPAWVYCRAI